MPDSLKAVKPNTRLADIAALTHANTSEKRLPPVESWHPTYETEMDLVIKRDGSWWHEGSEMTRHSLVKLFATILRKDKDGETYLVTPAEKIKINVECAHMLVTEIAVNGSGTSCVVKAMTQFEDIITLGPSHPLYVDTDPQTGHPMPLINIRGRLSGLLTKSAYYALAEHAVPAPNDGSGVQSYGIYSNGTFFSLMPSRHTNLPAQ